MSTQNILVQRYLQLLKEARPDVVAIKNPAGSLELSHILWMLEKMNNPDYKPLTTNEAWLSWIQASLFHHNLIHIQHERDITREIMSRKEYKYAMFIDRVEQIVACVRLNPDKYEGVSMHQAEDCLLTRLTGCFEGAMQQYFDKNVMEDRSPEVGSADYLVEALFGMDCEADKAIAGFVVHDGEEDLPPSESEEFTLSTKAWLNNAEIILQHLKDFGYVS